MSVAEFVVIKRDETEHWREDIQKKAGKIWGYYLYNKNEVIHLCEITPSYCLELLYYEPENYLEDEDERDALYNNLEEGQSEDPGVAYIHCRSIDALTEDYKYVAEPAEYDGEEEYEDALEKALEYFRGNRIFLGGK